MSEGVNRRGWSAKGGGRGSDTSENLAINKASCESKGREGRGLEGMQRLHVWTQAPLDHRPLNSG